MQTFNLHLVSLLLTFNKYLSTSNANQQRTIQTSWDKKQLRQRCRRLLFYSRILNEYFSCILIPTTNISTEKQVLRFQPQYQKTRFKIFFITLFNTRPKIAMKASPCLELPLKFWIMHLVCTQNFPKNWHFLPPDMHT